LLSVAVYKSVYSLYLKHQYYMLEQQDVDTERKALATGILLIIVIRLGSRTPAFTGTNPRVAISSRYLRKHATLSLSKMHGVPSVKGNVRQCGTMFVTLFYHPSLHTMHILRYGTTKTKKRCRRQGDLTQDIDEIL
jgi:hypothetical protein